MIYLFAQPHSFLFIHALQDAGKQIYIYAVNARNQWRHNQVRMCAARYEVHQSVIINLAGWKRSEGGLPLRQMSILNACIQTLAALRCDPQHAARVPVSGTAFPGMPVTT